MAAMLLVISATSFAQVKFGLKAGLNVANVNMDLGGVSLSPDSRVGAAAGAFVNIRLTDNFGIQPEMLYSMKGTKVSDSGFGETKLKLGYLSVPVMAKYYFGGFNLQAGPMFDFLLSAKGDSDGEEEDIKDDVKGMDLGLGFGLGYELPLGLSFDARYMVGLSDINDESGSENVEIKNKGFQITVGLAF